MGQYRRIPA